MPSREELQNAAERLYLHLLRQHYSNGTLHGPDAGIRFQLRLWRFLKSALDVIPWGDDYLFIQTQGYWILANWMLYELKGDPACRQVALDSTEATLRLQLPGGFWAYPLPERRHLIATVEGNWGAIGLLASYARERCDEYLAGALRWYEYLIGTIGFQEHSRGKAINYFDKPRGKIPNNSVEALWVMLRLWKATGDSRYLEHLDAMLEFLEAAELPSGELPYIVDGPYEAGRDHYLCFQYNSFQFLKLVWSYAMRQDAHIASMLPKVARFLERGITAVGASASDCHHPKPEVDYYTAVLAAALGESEDHGWASSGGLSDRCYARLLARQKRDGSFVYSQGDYGLLRDGRSYPRPQVMTLFHLLYPLCGDGFSRPVGG